MEIWNVIVIFIGLLTSEIVGKNDISSLQLEFPLNDETLSLIFNEPFSTKNESHLLYIAKTFYPSLLKTRAALGWEQGYTRKCFDNFGCCWTSPTVHTLIKPSLHHIVSNPSLTKRGMPVSATLTALSTRRTSRCKSDNSRQKDPDSCCTANRAWITPDILTHGDLSTYTVLQFEPDFYQGYYGVVDCRRKNCNGKCTKGTTAMSFLVMDAYYNLEMKSFEVPTHCLCIDDHRVN